MITAVIAVGVIGVVLGVVIGVIAGLGSSGRVYRTFFLEEIGKDLLHRGKTVNLFTCPGCKIFRLHGPR